MKTKNNVIHLFALLLVLVLVLTSIPVNVVAQGVSPKESVSPTLPSEDESTALPISQTDEKDLVKQSEVVALRTEYTKHFDMGDGTYQAVTYSFPVHRKDASGVWQNIDNTLISRKSGVGNFYGTHDSRVMFASVLSPSSSLLTFKENGYTIDMVFNSPNKTVSSAATIDNSMSKNSLISEDLASMNIEDPTNYRSTSSVKYKNVTANVDLEYVLYSNVVKENIIINNFCDNYTYSFYLELNNLVAELKTGIVYLRDSVSDEVVYVIPMPYMYDAVGTISYDVRYQLNEIETGIYELVIVADEDWINSSERQFPVVIDPTLSSTTELIYDTYVNAKDAETKATGYGYDSTMWISNPYRTTFIKSWRMPELPTGVTIIDARLKAAYYYYSGVTGGMYITAHQVTKHWGEMYSWDTMSNDGQDTSLGISSTALSTTYLGSSTTYPQWASIDITSAARLWYNGGTSASNQNYGVALKYKSGNSSVIFHSCDAMNDYAPYFTVTYAIPNGVYAIEKADADVYVKNNTLDSLAWVYQRPLTSPPTTANDRDYMFKIAYRVATDDYVIRSMSNNAIIIYPSVYNNAPVAGRVTVSGSPATDDNLPTTRTWKITTSSDGYDYIWYKEDGVTYYMQSTSNEGDSSRLHFTTNENDSGTKWKFHKYTGDPIDGIGRLNFERYLNDGDTYTHTAYMYSSTLGRNGPVSYSSGDSAILTVGSSSGFVTAIAPGDANIWVTYSGAPYMWGRITTVNSYSATIYMFYDKGYYTRYGESEEIAKSKLNGYINTVSNRYYDLLGLKITTNGAVYYSSGIDTCKGVVSSCGTMGTGCGHNSTSCNINALCTHSNPHTILFNRSGLPENPNCLSTHFNNNTSPTGNNIVTKAYWSGHKIQTYANLSTEFNRCYSSGSSIYMLELSSSSVRERNSQGILMHELNHQYGAPDHYHEILDAGTPNERCRGGDKCSVCGSNPRPSTCIMNRSRIDITASTVICPECRNDMYSHLEGHH